ncbi:aminopeptidase [Rhodoligotrophos defluvii]|uniref:aminopeptidase n=1 Tax=Rhodoligotrophos defluvii TaxID=2561934 RepID=UPI0010C9CF65|nr:aminopeptidase [Rhodoligotrophos defluvii]
MDPYSAHPAVDPVKLDRLADVAIRIGVQLRPGQDLIVTSPLSALPLVKRLVEQAYAAGARYVQPVLSDEELTLARFRFGTDVAFDGAPEWLYAGMAKAYGDNAARLSIYCDDPLLLVNEDPLKVARANEANSIAYKPALDRVTGGEMNYTIISYPSTRWAKSIFPDLPEHDAVAKLAEAIFAASRVDRPDPIDAWTVENGKLRDRCTWLDAQDFSALHFTGPGTDLRVGLAEGHRWVGGAFLARNGIPFMGNIPTEEVFTAPHANRVDGIVRSTMPLNYNGTLISDIAVTFERGQIVAADAREGHAVFARLLDADEGARRLGEVALVPHSSPISQSKILFHKTLFDENAASHIALGQCYSRCFHDAAAASRQDLAKRGGNMSKIHVDWMIGSDKVDVDGIRSDGSSVPVMRGGEWC